jgi:hypothetical protein
MPQSFGSTRFVSKAERKILRCANTGAGDSAREGCVAAVIGTYIYRGKGNCLSNNWINQAQQGESCKCLHFLLYVHIRAFTFKLVA